ncbi:MAG TPA: FAD-dependent monooxygenase [Steroidobacteraceae bacterium]|nr:FAD-dependent monooxygenase [Steroidobacteraceae bacterium]
MGAQSQSETLRVPVLVVGAGPAGLAASLLLQSYGTHALTVTKHRWTSHTPRAHHINPRAMELLRQLQLEDEVTERAMPRDLIRNVVWCRSLAGEEIGRIATYHHGGPGTYTGLTPCEALNIPQHRFEPVLAEALLARGGELLFNTECVSITQDSQRVRARLHNRVTGASTVVESDYLIGADGASSLVAREIGLELAGQAGWGEAVNIWLRADLTRFCAHRPGVLYWTHQPGNDFWIGSGVFIAVEPWNEWVVTLMHDPTAGKVDLSPDTLRRRIHHIIGDDGIELELRSISKWQMNAQYATRYSNGRVFCTGDAVHRHPPSNGLGANTSMLDARNLAWKLKLVLDGTASPDLLQTYDRERQPIGRATIERSMKSVGEFATVASALGYTSGQTPADGERALLTLRDPGPTGQAARLRLAQAIDLQRYQFAAVGFELGYRYREGALAPADAEERVSNDPDLIYLPDTAPGCHLPHAWVTSSGRRISTLDLLDGTRFLLLTGCGGECWQRAAREIRNALGLEVTVVGIGPGLQIEDPYGDWRRIRGVDDDGGVLVRPDGHVAWRTGSATSSAAQSLVPFLGRLLGRTSSTR